MNQILVAGKGEAEFPRTVQTILQQALQLRDRRQQRQISEQGLAVARGRLEVRMDRALERRYRSPQNRRLANHVLLTAGFAPQLWVASFLTSGSADYTIVMIGLPDPKRIVLKPQSELHPYIYAGHCHRQLQKGALSADHCWFNFRFSFRSS